METHNKTVRVEFTVEEANTVLEALGQLPFMRVYRIIEKIHISAQQSADGNSSGTIPK